MTGGAVEVHCAWAEVLWGWNGTCSASSLQSLLAVVRRGQAWLRSVERWLSALPGW